MVKRFLLPAVIAALCASTSQAAQLAAYVDGVDVDAAALVNGAAPVANTTVTDLTGTGLDWNFGGPGATITRDSFGGSIGDGEWLFGRSVGSDDSTVAASPDANYIEFSVTADAGFMLDLDNITYDFTSNSTGTGIFPFSGQAEAFVSTDGGTSFLSAGVANTSNTASGRGTTDSVDFNLDAFDGATSALIRIGFANLTTGVTNTDVNNPANFLQDLQLNGSAVPVPEPTTLALLAMTGMAAAVRRRR